MRFILYRAVNGGFVIQSGDQFWAFASWYAVQDFLSERFDPRPAPTPPPTTNIDDEIPF